MTDSGTYRFRERWVGWRRWSKWKKGRPGHDTQVMLDHGWRVTFQLGEYRIEWRSGGTHMTDSGTYPPSNLGCATTEELLREIACRLRDASTAGMRRVGYWCQSAADWGDSETLDYRSVDDD